MDMCCGLCYMGMSLGHIVRLHTPLMGQPKGSVMLQNRMGIGIMLQHSHKNILSMSLQVNTYPPPPPSAILLTIQGYNIECRCYPEAKRTGRKKGPKEAVKRMAKSLHRKT